MLNRCRSGALGLARAARPGRKNRETPRLQECPNGISGRRARLVPHRQIGGLDVPAVIRSAARKSVVLLAPGQRRRQESRPDQLQQIECVLLEFVVPPVAPDAHVADIAIGRCLRVARAYLRCRAAPVIGFGFSRRDLADGVQQGRLKHDTDSGAHPAIAVRPEEHEAYCHP